MERWFSPSPSVSSGRVPLYQRRRFLSGLGDAIQPPDLVMDPTIVTPIDLFGGSVPPPAGSIFYDPSTVDWGSPAILPPTYPTGFMGPLPAGAVVNPDQSVVLPAYDPNNQVWYDAANGGDLYVAADGSLTTDETAGAPYNPGPPAQSNVAAIAAKVVPSAASQIASVFSAIKKALTPATQAAGTYKTGPSNRASTTAAPTLTTYLPWILGGLGVALVLRKK